MMLDHLSGPSVVTILLRKKRGRKQAKGKKRDDDNRIRYWNAVGPHTMHASSLQKLEKARLLVLL